MAEFLLALHREEQLLLKEIEEQNALCKQRLRSAFSNLEQDLADRSRMPKDVKLWQVQSSCQPAVEGEPAGMSPTYTITRSTDSDSLLGELDVAPSPSMASMHVKFRAEGIAESQHERQVSAFTTGSAASSIAVESKSRKGTKDSFRSQVSPRSVSALADLERNLNGGDETWHTWRGTMRLRLDMVASGIVLVNAAVLMLELEVEGRHLKSTLGLGDDSWGHWPSFRIWSTALDIIFTMEWVTRICLDGTRYFTQIANIFDSVLVLASLLDLWAFATGFSGRFSRYSMRSVSSLRILRLLNILQFVEGLHLLLKACFSFMRSLLWSMVLLTIFLVVGALVLGPLLQQVIEEQEVSETDRLWLFERYGTGWRATYTLYEITLAGNWPVNTRPVMDSAGDWYGILFVAYITVVVFAVIRVISAVFLKDTLDAAQNDAELQLREKITKQRAYAKKLELIFRAIDINQDGLITEERLQEILSMESVQAYFQTLDLDVHESTALFHILDDGDGGVTLEEFIDGIMRCKGAARAIDQVAMGADIKLLDKRLSKLQLAFEVIADDLSNYANTRRKSRSSSDVATVSPSGHSTDRKGQQAAHLTVFRSRSQSSATQSMDILTWSSLDDRKHY
mmetsp:Transcript_9556/g.23053  ORF Transcript_9556/g.23053 Transcript_9556/m.23053 type:complete len:624 (-) Transcript_9556:17-1888(-)